MPFGISFGIGPFRIYSRRRRRRPRLSSFKLAKAKRLSARYNRARIALMQSRPPDLERRRADFERARQRLNEFSLRNPGYVKKVKSEQF